MSYNIGDAVPLVYTISGAATVVLTVTDPDGTVTNPATTPSGTGPVTYTAAVPATKAGTWLYRFVATGAVADAEDGQFQVEANATANVYSTLPEIKDALRIPQTDTDLDSVFESAILAVSREIDQHCQRHFYKITEARTFIPHDRWCIRLGTFNDLVSLTTLKTDASGDGTFETTWQTTDYQLLTATGSPNVNAGPEPQPYGQIRATGTQTFPIAYTYATARSDRVEITGTWGWPAIPTDVREACKLLAVESGKLLREAPFGVAGFGEFGVVRVRDNRKATQYLNPYRRIPVPVA